MIEDRPDCNIQLFVYGTPGEEGDGGKIRMIKKELFKEEVDICMMSHPAPFEIPDPICLGVATYTIVYKGML